MGDRTYLADGFYSKPRREVQLNICWMLCGKMLQASVDGKQIHILSDGVQLRAETALVEIYIEPTISLGHL